MLHVSPVHATPTMGKGKVEREKERERVKDREKTIGKGGVSIKWKK